MSKLESYYSHKAIITDGDSTSDLNGQAWDYVEDKLIREEVMPELMQRIAPVLAKVKTPLSININYDPKGFISLNFTRNCLQMQMAFSIGQQIPNDVVLPQTQQNEEEEASEGFVSEPEVLATDAITSDTELAAESSDETTEPAVKKKAKSVGFSVSFADGTVIHEKKAVQTWIKVLQKIGLDNIINNQRKHEAWHTVDGRNICIVDRVETVRSSDNASPQTLIDGYYVMTQLSNTQKVKDIESLGQLWPKLKIKVTWDEPASTPTSIVEESSVANTAKPKIDEDARYYSYPIIEQARNFMSRNVAERTANSYISTLDNAVRRFIHDKIDSNADSIFSYTRFEDVRLVIDMLNLDDEFRKENESRHNSMTAALNQYLKFISNHEKE